MYARHPKRSLREALEVAYDVWPPPRAVSPTQETKRPCGNGTAWSGAGSILRLSFGGVRLKAPLRAIGLLRSQRKRDAAGQEGDQETPWHPTAEESELQLSGHEQTHPLHIKWILVKTLRRLSEPDFEINPKCDGLNRGTLRRESAAARPPHRLSRSIGDFVAAASFAASEAFAWASLPFPTSFSEQNASFSSPQGQSNLPPGGSSTPLLLPKLLH